MHAKHMKRCEKRERDRQRAWRNTNQGVFESSFLHVDYSEAEVWEKSPSWLSDRGAGVEAIIRHCDGEYGENYYLRRLESARRKLIKHNRRLVAVFDLIVKNGKNRKESICQLALKTLRSGTGRKSCIGDT